MAKLSSIGRPYALAAFEYAAEKQQLQEWQAFLASAAALEKNPDVSRLLADPEIPAEQLASFFKTVLASVLSPERENFLQLLALNKRFSVLSEIEKIFNAYLAEYEKISTVRVVTAVEVDEPFRQQLIAVLNKRLHRQITLHCETDSSLIGGAIIHIGDQVIDGSTRGLLNRLLEFSLR